VTRAPRAPSRPPAFDVEAVRARFSYVQKSLAETWRPYKARPSASLPVGRRFETGAPLRAARRLQRHGRVPGVGGRLEAIREYERHPGARLLAGLPERVTLYGPPGMAERVPTFLLNVADVPAEEAARRLAERGLGVWYADNWYCVSLASRLPPHSLRAGIAHYNAAAEVDRLLEALATIGA
jgi:selenocysteine lyase/cysteine desulfurase